MEFNAFDSIKIGLASPEQIREWSYGEVKKPETIRAECRGRLPPVAIWIPVMCLTGWIIWCSPAT